MEKPITVISNCLPDRQVDIHITRIQAPESLHHLKTFHHLDTKLNGVICLFFFITPLLGNNLKR